VVTDRGEIETDLVVNAGGMFATEIGRMAGVNVPIIPMAHEYLITTPSGLPLDMPTMRDPSLLVYYRPESGGLIMGGYERDPALGAWTESRRTSTASRSSPMGSLRAVDDERDHPTPSIKDAGGEVGERPDVTPDGEFILGPARYAASVAPACAHGLAGAGAWTPSRNA
jgi:4-methylaminobutanoate oxidase (formaldehyde-forming)